MNRACSAILRLLIVLTVATALAPRAHAGAPQCAQLLSPPYKSVVVPPLTLAQIHHVVLGAGNPGDPVLLIHGVGSSLETFRAVATELAMTRKVVLFDLRGHGSSLDPGEGYDLPTLVSDLKSLISGLKLSRVQLIGHSAGAKITMLFAAQYPDLVSSVTIEDSGVLPMGTTETPDKIRRDAQFLRSLTRDYVSPEQLARDLLPLAENDSDKALELAQKVFPSGTRQSAVTSEFWKNFKSTDNSSFLRNFEKPVLFLRAAPGTRYFTVKDVELIQKQMPNAKIVSIENSSHSIHETTPQQWLLAIKPFLR